MVVVWGRVVGGLGIIKLYIILLVFMLFGILVVIFCGICVELLVVILRFLRVGLIVLKLKRFKVFVLFKSMECVLIGFCDFGYVEGFF